MAPRDAFVVALSCLAVAAGGCASAARSQQVQDDPFPRLFRTLRPSVVLFTMHVPSDEPRKKGHWDEAYGSGLIVYTDDHVSRILTVEHVIHDARDLKALIGDRKAVAARTIAQDEKADLALVEVDVPHLRVARLGASARVEAGDAIGVAGYPIPDAFQDEGLGTASSVYAGRVSSVRKDAFELDVPVIPGESGGPVFDATSGDVIGLAESRFEEEKAIGFAIPIDDATRFLEHARAPRVASRASSP